MAYSIWLEFDETSTSVLRSEIWALSEILGGPMFEPHMTLIGDIDLPVEPVIALAKEFARGPIPTQMEICRVSTAPKYFMALYLSVQIPEQLKKTRMQISQKVNSNGYSLDDPHVSLAYGEFEKGVDRQAISKLEEKFVGTNLDVSYLNIVQSSKCTPISEWKTVSQVEFC